MPIEKDNGVSAVDDLMKTVKAEMAERAASGKTGEEGDPPEEEAAAAVEAAAAEGEGEEPVEEEADGEEKPKPDKGKEKPVRNWESVRADRLRNQAKEERAAAAAARQEAAESKAEIARLRALVERKDKGETVDDEAAKPRTDEERQAEAVKRAKQELVAEATAKEFVGKADKLYDDGVKAFGQKEFDEARDNILGYADRDFGLFQNNQGRVDFLQRLLDTVDNPERVLFLMGQDPEEAEKIVAMPERRQIASFVKLSTARQRKAPVSEAPEPIEELKPSVTPRAEYRGASTPAHVFDKLYDDTMTRIAEKRRG